MIVSEITKQHFHASCSTLAQPVFFNGCKARILVDRVILIEIDWLINKSQMMVTKHLRLSSAAPEGLQLSSPPKAQCGAGTRLSLVNMYSMYYHSFYYLSGKQE